jgi:hypothetical protein
LQQYNGTGQPVLFNVVNVVIYTAVYELRTHSMLAETTTRLTMPCRRGKTSALILQNKRLVNNPTGKHNTNLDTRASSAMLRRQVFVVNGALRQRLRQEFIASFLIPHLRQFLQYKRRQPTEDKQKKLKC